MEKEIAIHIQKKSQNRHTAVGFRSSRYAATKLDMMTAEPLETSLCRLIGTDCRTRHPLPRALRRR
jgi:hypothetical protein